MGLFESLIVPGAKGLAAKGKNRREIAKIVPLGNDILLFAKAEKVGKTAFAQSQRSAKLPARAYPRKEGIRIPNAPRSSFTNTAWICTFRDWQPHRQLITSQERSVGRVTISGIL